MKELKFLINILGKHTNTYIFNKAYILNKKFLSYLNLIYMHKFTYQRFVSNMYILPAKSAKVISLTFQILRGGKSKKKKYLISLRNRNMEDKKDSQLFY